jgi:hypothetical protein
MAHVLLAMVVQTAVSLKPMTVRTPSTVTVVEAHQLVPPQSIFYAGGGGGAAKDGDGGEAGNPGFGPSPGQGGTNLAGGTGGDPGRTDDNAPTNTGRGGGDSMVGGGGGGSGFYGGGAGGAGSGGGGGASYFNTAYVVGGTTYLDIINPTITALSSSSTNGTYKFGSSITITATASETITAGSRITVTLETGATDRQVVLTASADGVTLTGTYTVQAGDVSADLTASSFTFSPGDVTDLAGLEMTSSTLPASNIASSKAIVVDGVVPTASLTTASLIAPANASVQSSKTGTVYLVNTSISPSDTSTITAADGTLWNSVSITTANSNTNLATTGLIPGTYKAYAVDASGNFSQVSTGTVTVTPSTPTPAPDLTAASDTGSSNTDNATADATPTFTLAGLTVGANITVTATPATGSAVTCTFVATATSENCTFATMDNGTYSVKVKQTINGIDSADSSSLANVVISATPIAAPAVADLSIASDLGSSNSDNVTSDNTPTFSIAGPFAGTAVLTATKAGSTTVTCTVSANACTTTALADGDWLITVTDTDAAGNTATSTPITVTIDTTAPTVASVSASNANGSYKVGETITVLVTFSETVTVTGTPLLTLETGATDRNASYISGSGSNTLAFAYVIQAGDTSADLNYLATTSLALNSGTILDTAGKIATLTLPALAGASSLAGSKAIVIDGVAPTISSLSSTSTDRSYKAGDSITITATASEAVVAGSFITVTLETGATDRQVVLTASADGTTLTGTYVVQAGDSSADLTANAFSVGATDVRDIAGNYLSSTTLPTGGNNIAGAKAIVVDGVLPSASATTASILASANAVVQSTELGTAYLVNTSVTVSDSASITSANTSLWNSVSIATANTNTNLAATGLVPGTYKVYALDGAGNLSSASTNTVTVLPPTPTPAPDLQAASDTGSSNSDNTTADNTPTFDVAGLTSGAIVTLTATPSVGSPVTCTFTASGSTGSCNFSSVMANGTYSVVVSQNVNGVESAASSALSNLRD